MDYQAAGYALRMLRDQGRDPHRKLNVYKCKFCRGYHVGKSIASGRVRGGLKGGSRVK